MKVIALLLALALVATSSAASIGQSENEPSFVDETDLVSEILRQDNGKIGFEVKSEGGQLSWNVDAEQKVWSSQNGFVSINGGIRQPAGGKATGHVGIQGEINWKK